MWKKYYYCDRAAYPPYRFMFCYFTLVCSMIRTVVCYKRVVQELVALTYCIGVRHRKRYPLTYAHVIIVTFFCSAFYPLSRVPTGWLLSKNFSPSFPSCSWQKQEKRGHSLLIKIKKLNRGQKNHERLFSISSFRKKSQGTRNLGQNKALFDGNSCRNP